MMRSIKTFLWIGKASFILAALMLPFSHAMAQSEDTAPLEESAPNSTTVQPETPDSAPPDDGRQTTVTQLIEQGNDAYLDAQYEEAIEAYSQAIALYGRNAYAYYNRGNAYRKLDNAEAAFRDYTLSLKLRPNNHYALYYRGILFMGVEEYENALLDFTAALELTDRNPLIYEKRGDVNRKLKNKKAARQDYQEAIKLYNKQGKAVKAKRLRRKAGEVTQ